MKKIILSLAMILSMGLVNAQESIGISKITDNWYLGVQGSVLSPLDFNSVFPLNPAVSLKLGKRITPAFGFNFEGTAVLGDNHFTKSKTFVKASYLGANATLDFINLLNGFSLGNKFHLVGEAGFGWIHAYKPRFNDLGVKTGLMFYWNISDAWDFYTGPEIYWNVTKREKEFNKHHAQIGLSLGLVYRFKNSNGLHTFKKYNNGAYERYITDLEEELAKKPKEIIKEKIVKVSDTSLIIEFAQGSFDLTRDAIQRLNGIKKGAEVDIRGTASEEGDPDKNKVLSEQRAQVVASYLKSRGVIINSAKGIGTYTASNRLAYIMIR